MSSRFAPLEVSTNVNQLLLVGDLTWPHTRVPELVLQPELESDFSLLPGLAGPLMPPGQPRALRRFRRRGVWNDPAVLTLLARGRTCIVAAANDHITDYSRGIDYSRAILHRSSIVLGGAGSTPADAAKAVRVTLSDGSAVLLCFLGDSRVGCLPPGAGRPGVNVLRPKVDAIALSLWRRLYSEDYLVAVLHWGSELQVLPEPGQRAFARQLARLGVDLVVGQHAHFCQAWEVVGGTPIYYGLGSFLVSEKHHDGVRVSYPSLAEVGAGILVASGSCRVVRLEADTERGVVRQIGRAGRPEDTWLLNLARFEQESDASYAKIYRQSRTVPWWYPARMDGESALEQAVVDVQMTAVDGVRWLARRLGRV